MVSRYRGDIDGLRCIAVMSVVLFHAGFSRLSGGFVGVDVFFVISGFLITGIIVREMDEGRFSFARFYERRVRRILPAVVVVLLASLAFAMAFLTPPDAHKLGEAAIATIFSVANIYFYLTVDYFGPTSDDLPLLHMWSLGVEEQFYLILPFVLLVAVRYARSRLLLILAGITLVSFIGACWSVALSKDGQAAFYLLPFRAWELGLGSLLAVWQTSGAQSGRWRGWIAEAMGLAGLALIGGSVLLIDGTTPFPGLAALPPCLGAALLIASGSTETLASRLLSLPPMRWIGLISYSLYLWHWPVLVLSKLGVLQVPMGRAGAVGLAIGLAWLSWRYVEQPFRSGRMPAATVFKLVGGGVGGMLATSVTLAVTLGLPQRFDPQIVRLASFVDYDHAPAYREGHCFLVEGSAGPIDRAECLSADPRRPDVLLFGDSHAAHLWYGLAREAPEVQVSQLTMASCRPTLASLHSRDPGCRRIARMAFEDVLVHRRFDRVIIAGAWQSHDVADVRETLDWFAKRSIPVVLVGRGATYQADVPRLLAFAHLRDDPALPSRYRIRRTGSMDHELAMIAKAADVPFVPLTGLECGKDGCVTELPGEVPIRFDRGHLTAQGSRWIARAMLNRGGLRQLL